MATETTTPIMAIKGFDKDLKCRDFQFAPGETYTHKGKVKACNSGFHAITGHPLAVLGYYPPAGSRFCRVELSGSMHSDDDVKTAAEIIKIGEEIGLSDLASEAVKWVFDRAKWSEGSVAANRNEGATASGDQGAATASGDQGAATASGTRGAATASGKYSAAMSVGFGGMVSGAVGSALFLVRRRDNYGCANHSEITNVWAGIVGVDGIKPDVFYTLNDDGKPVEVSND